ncbi:15795_t:CDS:2, partial [Cetraspora pellucida]
MRKTYEIRNYFHPNIKNTKLECDICKASYNIKKNSNFVTTQNNIQEILPYNGNKYHATVQDDTDSEPEIEEIIETGQALMPIKRKLREIKNSTKKQK